MLKPKYMKTRKLRGGQKGWFSLPRFASTKKVEPTEPLNLLSNYENVYSNT